MQLSEIASVAGKGGLFKILKPTRTGVVLESMDKQKKKLIASAHHRVSTLNEISIYTTSAEGSRPLAEVLKKIYEDFADDPGIDSNTDPEELKGFIKHIVPEYDESRVYASDIKKLVSWYKIILKQAPEILNGEADAEADAKTETPEEGNNE
ncbi:MAG: DUF5606 domain-containing protein [Cyclobacteriaceae bacterium]|nr:DUF5606 domain-containing protein [Cyclobacteriaceae bacterium]